MFLVRSITIRKLHVNEYSNENAHMTLRNLFNNLKATPPDRFAFKFILVYPQCFRTPIIQKIDCHICERNENIYL